MLVLTVLEIGVYSGVRIPPEEIEKIMQLMHRTKVEYVLKIEDNED
jgi:hypothetical protein